MEKKTVLITGASSGIGEGCARKFAMNGYRLILNGRNVEKLTAVKRELETEYRADVCLLPFDVRSSYLLVMIGRVYSYSLRFCCYGKVLISG
mgnify:CR=1 FL=1